MKRDRDLNDEIRAHQQMAASDGRDPREFGNVALVKETTREMWAWIWLERLWQDLRYGIRWMARSPGFTAVAILSLGLGIGANTALFSVINALMLRTLDVNQPGELVVFKRTFQGDGRAPYGFDHAWFEKFQKLTELFSGATAIHLIERSDMSGTGDADPQVRVSAVSGNYFSLLGVSARKGRTLTDADDLILGAHPVAVISYGYWERRYGLAAGAIGSQLRLHGTDYTILGVTARGFSGEWVGRPTDVWVPIAMLAQVANELKPLPERGGGLGFRVVARLKPGISIEQAQAGAQVLYQQILQEERLNANSSRAAKQRVANARFYLEPAATGFSPQRESFSQPLVILMAMVGAVLLIACANIANLLLARAAAREREIRVRLAIGAGRARIIRQLLTESLLLAVLSGLTGLALAHWGTRILAQYAGGGFVWRNDQTLTLDLSPDLRVFSFSAVLCLLTAVVFGLAPALRASQISLGHNQRSGLYGRFGAGKALVVVQVALSLVLLIGAGLFGRTLYNLKSQDLGLDRERILLIWTAARQSGRRIGAPVAQLYERVQERVSALPGVTSVSISKSGILTGDTSAGCKVKIDGYTPPSGGDPAPSTDLITPRFFDTLGIRVLLGRDFSSRDSESAPRVVIVNEALAQHYFSGENPLGKRIGFECEPPNYRAEIIGVVSNARHVSAYDKNVMKYYVPYRQDINHLISMCVIVRTAANPASIASRVRAELREVDPNLPVLRMETIEDQLNDSLVQERWIALLGGFFAVLAAILAGIGLFGVMAYLTTRRTQEIGVRLALGASRAGVLGMVLRETGVLIGAGVLLGIPTALAAGRWMATRLFGITPSDPLTIGGSVLLMVGVAGLAVLIPARRAAKVDPMVALRYE
jgi:predicted permease